MSFRFNLSDRVTVKTADIGPVEGIVSGAKAMLNSESEYDVHYLLPDLRLQHIVVGETALTGMQPAPMMPVAEAQALVKEAHGLAARAEERLGAVLSEHRRRARKASRSRKRR